MCIFMLDTCCSASFHLINPNICDFILFYILCASRVHFDPLPGLKCRSITITSRLLSDHVKMHRGVIASILKADISLSNLSSSGEDVPTAHCEGDPPPAELACEVACSADCVVGSWSSWSACSHSCATKNAEGRQSRTRTVLALPGKGKGTHSMSMKWCVVLVFLHFLVMKHGCLKVTLLVGMSTYIIPDVSNKVTERFVWQPVAMTSGIESESESGEGSLRKRLNIT